ncbi:MAG: type I methionyl aminopeptidase [Patescibacteria group bacterium]|nr:type I methionyl aminopeptidase [Patescibacteria group bacterium]
MIKIKNEEQIKIMSISGHILAESLFEVVKHVKPGATEIELDELAEKLILEKGGEPGFKKVPGYHNTICISTNDVVVHGVPTNYKLKEGDVVGIDCGVFYKGFHSDMSETVRVKPQTSNLKPQKDGVDKFLETGKRALEEGIKAAKPGNHVGDISKTIQDIVERQGYSVVRSLVGHGVGKELHEDPEIPGYLVEPVNKTPVLKVGMTIAIEVIYNMGKSDVVYGNNDGWTIKTEDGRLSGLFERTVAITKNGPVILTK